MIGIFTVAAAVLAAVSPKPITLGEDKPRQFVRMFVEEGEFPQPGLKYRVSYTSRDRTHSFVLSANGRRATIELSKSEFPGLDASQISVAPRSYKDPELSVHVQYGPAINCANVSVRERLIFSLEETAKITKLSYTDCELQLIDLGTAWVKLRK